MARTVIPMRFGPLLSENLLSQFLARLNVRILLRHPKVLVCCLVIVSPALMAAPPPLAVRICVYPTVIAKIQQTAVALSNGLGILMHGPA